MTPVPNVDPPALRDERQPAQPARADRIG
jgi:hypothetical protein